MTTTVKVNVLEGAVRKIPLDVGRALRVYSGTFFKQEAVRISKTRLSPVVGPQYKNYHRPKQQPGRTGRYDKHFRVSSLPNGTLICSNTSPYASIVEKGTGRTNYRIPKSRSGGNLYFYHYGSHMWVTRPKVKGVIHPGPWRNGNANSKGRASNPAFGEVEGFGAWIVSDAARKTLAFALLRINDQIKRSLAK